VFITGGGSVGKSFLLRMIQLGLQELQVEVVKLAPTGIAAQNIGGQTIHRFFGMSNVVSVPNLIRLDEFVKTHEQVVFLNEEVTMISHEQIDIINNALMTATNSNQLFGGLAVIFLGDFAQLPLIELLEQGLLLDHPIMPASNIYTLQPNQRVRANEQELEQFLRLVRFNTLESVLVKQIIAQHWFALVEISMDVTLLFTRNQRVEEAYTAQALGQDNITTYESIDFSARNNRSLINALDKTYLVQELKFRVGVLVILLHNFNVEQGWVNGSFCLVHELLQDAIVVRKRDTLELRNISRITRSVSNTAYARTQSPLRLAYALTIHRVQSLTLNEVAICMDDPFLSHGQLYTACSRVTNLRGLHFFRRGMTNVSVTSNRFCFEFAQRTEIVGYGR